MKNKRIKVSIIIFIALITFICLLGNTKVQAKLLDKTEEFMVSTCKRYEYGNGKYTVVPKYNDYTIYCTNPGARCDFVQSITLQEINNLINQGYRFTISCGTLADLPDKYHTYPYYQKSGSGSLTNALAYIVTIDGTEWTLEKQLAMWQMVHLGLDGGIITRESSYHDDDYSGKGYEEEARNYNVFAGLSKNLTVTANNNTLTKIDQTTKQYTVGSFSVNYTNGTYGNVTFGGISDMYLIGYNEKGQQVKNIAINKFVINNKEVTPRYFSPDSINYVDTDPQAYPDSGENFQVVFSDPNKGVTDNNQIICDVELYVEYKYMSATGQYVKYSGQRYGTGGKDGTFHDRTYNPHEDKDEYIYTCGSPINSCAEHEHVVCSHRNTYNKPAHEYDVSPVHTSACKHIHNVRCTGYWTYKKHTGDRVKYQLKTQKQQGFSSMDGERELHKLDAKTDKIKIRMDLGGYVWEDSLIGKESKYDGLNNTTEDKAIQNIRVILYDKNNNKIAEKRTDSDGCYLFTNLDPMKKYYVAFEYNGQLYIPTTYKKEGANWKNTSKATEISSNRTKFDNMFAEIGAYPNNYKRSNGKYNKAYSQYELMGFKLDANGKYYYDKSQHYIDTFYTIDKNGNIIEGKKINPAQVSSGDAQKVNFVNDCKIVAYTQAQQNKLNPDLYPAKNQFVINKTEKQKYTTGKQARATKFSTNAVKYNGKTYEPLYPDQFFIDLGLVRRNEVDLALRKDILYATTKINSKTEIYQYDKRANNDEYWLIEYRMRNYADYYGGMYVNGIYQSDYRYRGARTNGGSDLEAYVTYKITVRNSSIDVLGQITEIVDYYDKDYTYMPKLSWAMYKDNEKDDNTKIALKKEDYYNMIANNDLSKIPNKRNITTKTSSKYGTKSDIAKQMNVIYISGLENKKLAVGEQAYIYLTFKVNKDGSNPITLDKNNEFKMNYAEINGYKTYYTGNIDLPNGVKKTSNNAAGLIDINSTPGNLKLSDITGNKYEKNFENDTDRAKGIQIKIDDNSQRQISGTVWEDQRTEEVSGATVGDGVRQDNEIKIQGVTVQLVEKLSNGKEFLWQTTTTKADGTYTFSKFIPGNYIVRFMYGHNNDTVLTTSNGGKNNVSYNGQDFKSTIYQKNLKNQKEISGYEEEYYNIKKADSFGANLSDAKDIWENKVVSIGQQVNNLPTAKYQDVTLQGRVTVNKYLTTKVTNHNAEILASPYATTKNNTNIKELQKNTQMVAETAIIVIEGEYDRQTSTGDTNKDKHNYDYKLQNLDFGLTERPKAQLELNKQVTNVKITLANGNVLFDANDAVANLAWIKHKDYGLMSKMKNGKYEEYYNKKVNEKYNRYSYKTDLQNLINNTLYRGGKNGLIQVTMDSELMHGATIQISYKLTVKNVGETDYTGRYFYYKATVKPDTSKITTTTATLLVDYVPNNLQYRAEDNNGWTVVKAQDLITTGNINGSIEAAVNKYNTILVTDKMNKALKPGETVTKELVLTQTITSQNTQDNMTYGNIAEILQTSNTVGRRMAFSIVGNQDPTKAPTEVDSSKAEEVVILPPFGQMYLYFGLGIAVLAVVAGAVIVIKKKVLKK